MCDHFHLTLGIVRRSRGGSAERRSAYQSRAYRRLSDGTFVDYTAREDHVETLMLAPAGAPDWARNTNQFWRKAAAAEKRADAQEARLLELSLPRGLPRAAWADIARKLGSSFVALGMVVQVDIHCTTAYDGKPYPHLHMMMSMRELQNGKFAAKKARHWNQLFHGKAAALREKMADFLNAYCRKKGVDYEADPRSNAERGLPAAEMTLPRWNFLSYQRTGKKTPWLEQRDRERAARANIAALEAECKRLEQQVIALRRLESLASHTLVSFADIERNTLVSPGANAPQRRPMPTKNPQFDRFSGDQPARKLGSPHGNFSSMTTPLPRPPTEPDELSPENLPWRPG